MSTSRASVRMRWRTVASLALAAGTLAPAFEVTLIPVPPAAAAIVTPFTAAYATNDNGAIDLVGNALLTCPATAANCSDVLAGTRAGSNNNFSMVPVDRDGDASTTSSSSARLAMPAGSTVLFAGLYWAANSNDTTGRRLLKFRAPGGAYQAISATELSATGSLYQGFADVTSTVRSGGNGVYWGADIKSFTGSGQFAGWSMAVVYSNPALPMRNLTVFDGFATVSGSERVDIPVSGFLSPPFGAVTAEVGVVAYEGDWGISGDQFLMTNNLANNNFVNVTNGTNPTTNFFNSTITNNGVSDTSGDPSTVNVLSMDIDEVTTVGIVPNSATASTLRMVTTGDAYYPGVVTYAVDLYSPAFPAVTKTVVDVNGGNAEPGDTLEYSITMQNTGLDPAINSVMRDTLPPNASFVPGSIRLNGVNMTDAAGDDLAELAVASRTTVARVGTGATATTGGRLNPGDTFNVTFRVRLDDASAGTTVQNTVKLDYRALTIGKDFAFTSNTVSTPVTPRADLTVTKSGTPLPVIAGTQAIWTVTVTNRGPNPATGVTVGDTVGAGHSVVSATWPGGSCAGSSPTISCALDTIAVGASVPILIVTNVDPALADGSSVVNNASVRANEADPRPGDEAAAATLAVRASADVSVTKRAEPDPITAGATTTYVLTVVNAGPSVARAVSVGETLPENFTAASVVANVGTCTPTGACDLGDLTVGAAATITVFGSVAADATSPVTNQAAATSTTSDPDAANNAVTLTTPVISAADVSISKATVTTPIVAGAPIRWVLTATNAGPSTAQAVVVRDAIPAGVTITSVSTPLGTCTVAAEVVCTIGAVGPGGSIEITVDGTVAAGTTGTLTNVATIATSSTQPAGGGLVDRAEVRDPVVVRPDLRVAKAVDHNPLVAGEAAMWTLTVTNDGPSASGWVTLTDSLPPQAVGPSITNPGGGTCSLAAGVVGCTWTGLAPGEMRTVVIAATIDAAATGVDVNRVSVTTAGDPNPVNDVAESRHDLIAVADVSAAKSWASTSVVAGTTSSFTIRAANAGPSAATTVRLIDTLPAGVALSGALPASCSSTGATIECQVATLAAGASAEFVIPVAIDADQSAGPLPNTVDIALGVDDPNAGNNQAVATTTVTRQAALSLTKSAAAPTTVAGTTMRYTVVARNDGPSSAQLSLLGDQLPAGTTVVAPLPAGCTEAGGLMTCDLGTLAPGASRTIEYAVAVDPSVPAATVLANRAQLTSATPFTGVVAAAAAVTVAAEADLGVTKVAEASSVVAGETLDWVITVTNRGPSVARTVSIDDALPAGYTASTVTTTAGTCSGAPVVCAVGDLAVGASATINVLGRLDAGYNGPTIVNSATVAATTAEPASATAPNSATASAAVVTEADLVVAKAVNTATILAGDGPLTYTITISNRGPSNATDVRIDDELPAAFAGATTTAPGCTIAANRVSCALGTLDAGAAPVTILVTGHVPSDTPAGAIDNTARATSATALRNPDNDTATATTTVERNADVWVLKSPNAPTTVAGEVARWTITVGNDGTSTAEAVVITDELAANLDPAGATATATAGSCAITGTEMRCDLGPGGLSPGALVFITVEATVRTSAEPGLTNLVNTATVTSATPDADPADNSATAISEIIASADVHVTKSGVSPAVAGGPVTWTITVSNVGPSAATGVILTDPAPTGMTATTVSGGGCSALPCTLGTLAVGERREITFSGTIDAAFTGIIMSNTATVAVATPDPNSTNNTARASISVNRQADLTIAKRADREPIVAGESLTYTLEVTNPGPSVARSVTISDSLPAGLSPSGALPAGCTFAAPTVTCTLGDLPVSATPVARSITVAVAATAAAGSSVVNAATVSSPTDLNAANNEAQVTSTVATGADLAITKTAEPTPIVPGSPVAYTLTVTNSGPSTARAVTVSDPMPAGLTATAATPTPSGATCDLGATVTCRIGDLDAGTTATVIVTAASDASLSADVVNTASATSETPEATPADNTVSLSTPVAALADVTIAKSVVTSEVVPGRPVRYALTVRNLGPSTARGVTIADVLAAGLTPVAASSSAGSCTVAATITCALGDIPPNPDPAAPITILIDADLDAGFVGELANTATITTTTAQPAGGGEPDEAAVVVPVVPTADLRVVKTAPNVAVVAGTPVSYTVEVFNDGPSVATGVRLADVVPPELDVVTITPATDCTVAAEIVCAWADPLAAGTSRLVTIDATVRAGALAVTDNVATVTAVTGDPEPANDRSVAGVELITYADVRLSKTGPAGLIAGTSGDWVLTVENAGPSDAQDLVVSDSFPPGIVPIAVEPADACAVGVGGDAQLVSCTFAPLPAGAIRTIRVTAVADAALAAGPLTNTAVAATPTPDDDRSDNTAVATTRIVRATNLTITKVADAPTVVAGERVAWTITVSNPTGPSTAEDVQVSDQLPAGVTFVSVEPAAACSATGGLVTCRPGNLAVGATTTVRIIADVNPDVASDVAATIINTATVSTITPGDDPADSTADDGVEVTRIADLAVVKTVAPLAVAAGEEATWTVEVTNAGPSDALGVQLTETLPATFLAAGITDSLGACTAVVASVDCAAVTIPVGGTWRITVSGRVDPVADDGTIINRAAVTATTGQGVNAAPDSADANLIVTRSADVTITKLATPDPVIAGETITWTIRVGNTGPSDARDVEVTDVVPAGLSDVVVGGAGCTAMPCVIGTLAVGGSIEITITATVEPSYALAKLTNTATVTSTTPDPHGSNNTSDVTADVTAQADLSVSKSATPSPATAGEAIGWTIVVANNGASDARDVAVTDDLPAGVVNLTTPGNTCSITTTTVSCTRPVLAAGETWTVTLDGFVEASNAATTLTNRVAVTSATTDADADDQTFSLDTPLTQRAVLRVDKQGVDTVAGTTTDWTIRVTNDGPSHATAVELVDDLPAALVGATIVEPVTGCTIDAKRVTCALGTLATGATTTVVARATVDAAFGPGPIENAATVTSPIAGEPAVGVGTIAVTTLADVSVTKTGPVTVVPGVADGVTWTVTARNDGPSEARGVIVTDAIPPEITGYALSGAACATFPCDLGTLVSGAEVVLTVTATVDAATTSALLHNVASIATTTPETDTADNTATADSTITPTAALVVAKTGPATAAPGTTVTWEITVRNEGPSVARAVELADVLPGAAGTPTVEGDCTALPCTLGDLAPGATRSVRVSAVVDPAATAAMTNRATLTSPTSPALGDDRAAEVITELQPVADLGITKSFSGAAATPGAPVRWTVVVTNPGPSTATAVEVSDILPSAALVDAALSTDTGSCAGATCSLGDLAPGSTATITIDATVRADWLPGTAADGTDGTLDNTATVTSPTPDPGPTPNDAATATPVAPAADLRVAKTGPDGPVVPGEEVRWTITVVNDGPSTARRTILTDPLPIGIADAAVTDADGRCAIVAGEVRCALGVLAPNEQIDLIVTGRLASGFADPKLLNTATVASATPDPDPADNASEAGNDVTAVADVTVTLTPDPLASVAGSPLAWTIDVVNSGPSDAQATVLNIPLPASIIEIGDPVLTGAPAGTTWRVVDGILIVEVGALAPGQPLTIAVAGRISPSFTGTAIDLTAAVSTTTVEPPDHDPNSASVGIPITTSASVSLTKFAVPNPVIAGEALSWTIRVANAGPSDAQDVEISDVLPVGFLNPVVGGAGCTTLPCRLPVLAAGATIEITVAGTVAADFTGSTIANTASASSSTPDPSPFDNTQTASAEVRQIADISVTKVAEPTTATAGEPIRWAITARNDGSSTATDLVITDVLPAEMSAIVAPGCTIDAATVTCARSQLSPNEVWVVTIEGTVASVAAGASIINTVSIDSPTPDADTGDDTFSLTTPLVARAVVRATKTGTDTRAGERTTWTITVSNDGPSWAQAVTVTDDLPIALSDLVIDAPADGCTLTGNRLDCLLGALADGATRVITVSGRVDPDYGTGPLTNVATITSPTAAAPVPVTGTIEVTAAADMSIAKQGPATAVPGVANGITWTVTIRNDGPSNARDVVVADIVPVEVAAWSLVGGGPLAGGGCTTFPCSLGAMAPGAEVVLTITGTIDPAASAASITNVATVTSPTPDPDPADGRAEVTTALTPAAALSIDKAGPASAVPGTPIAWTIAVANAGPSVARGVELADLLPAALDPATVVVTGDCAAVPCVLGDLAVGATRLVSISGELLPGATGTIENSATLTSTTPPADGDDRSDTVTTELQPSANLQVAKVFVDAPAVPGRPVRWVVTVANLGPSTATAVEVADTLPSVALTSVTLSSDTGSCDAATCRLGDLGPGAVATIAVDGVLRPDWLPGTAADGSDGTLDNTAHVSSPTPDPDPANTVMTATVVAPSADVRVSKVGPDGPVVPGEEVRWSIAVANDGPSTATLVTLDDVIPAGVVEATVTDADGRCAIVAAAVHCDLGSLAPGEQVDLVVTGRVVTSYLDPRLLNTATVAAATPDPAPANNSSEAGNDVETRADVTVTAVSNTAEAVAGAPVTWTFTVSNSGPSDAQATTVRIAFPASLIGVVDPVIAGEPAGTTWRFEGGELIVEFGALPPGAPVTLTVASTISPSFTGDTVAVPIAVTTTTTQPDGHDPDTAAAQVAVVSRADVSVTKAVTPNPVVAGEPIRWTIVVTNAGPSDARDTTVGDTIPTGLTGVVVSGSGCSTLPCTLGTLAPGGTATVLVDAVVDPAYLGDTLVNAATVVSTTTDPDPADNAATVSAAVERRADLSVVKSASPSVAVAGRPMSWTVTVANPGSSDARDVVVTDTFPFAVVPNPTIPVECTADPAAGTITCRRPVLAAGAQWTLTFDGTVASGATLTEVANTATVASATPDPDTDDLTATVVTPLERLAAVRATKSGTDTVAGERTTWLITIVNDGPSDAADLRVVDDLPVGLIDPAVVSPLAGCAFTDRQLACALGTLIAGATTSVVVSAQVAPDFGPGPIVNTATISSPTAPAPIDATGTIATTTRADVSVTKIGPATTIPGVPGGITWTVTVANTGPSEARQVVVADAVPVEVGGVGIGGAACVVFPCELGTLAPGAEVTLTVTGTVAPGRTAPLVNAASVTTTTPDPDPANDQATATTASDPRAALRVDKTGPTTAVPGTPATWTITVVNDGPSTAVGAVLDDALPAALDPATVVVAGDCTALPCALGDLAPGAIRTATVTATVRAAATGAVSNTATLTSATPAPVGGDSRADTTVTELVPSADLRIAKAFAGTSATPGRPARWTITVTNVGPSTATGVVVEEAFDAAALIDALLAPSAGSCTAARCELGDLAPGAEVTITLDAAVRAGWLPGTAADGGDGTLANRATVTSPTVDPAVGDNTAVTSTSVIPDADLAVTKTGPDGPVVPGEEVRWTISVRNDGPSDALDVVLTDEIPAVISDVAVTEPGGLCTLTGTALRCALGRLTPGTQIDLVIAGRLDAGFADPRLLNTAVVTSPTPDSDPTDNTSEAGNDVTARADVTIAAAVDRPAAHAGEPTTWSFSVVNSGPSTAGNTVMRIALPAALIDLVDPVITGAPPGAAWRIEGGVLIVDAGALPPGAPFTVVVGARISPAFTGPAIVVSATVTTTTTQPEGHDPDEASATIAVSALVDLRVAKSATPDPVIAGEPVTWTITVTNLGPSDAAGVELTDDLPVGIGPVSVAGGGCIALACALGTVAAGATVTITVTGTIESGYAPATIVNAATVTSTTPDSDPASNRAVATSGVRQLADLSVIKTAGRSGAVAGEPISWEIVVRNVGSSDAVSLVVTDLLPIAAVPDASTTDPGCSLSEATMTCRRDRLVAGGEWRITVTGTVATGATGETLANSASVTATTPDVDAADQAAEVTIPLTRVAVLRATKRGVDVAAGERTTWTMVVVNDGPSDAADVRLADDLPTGLSAPIIEAGADVCTLTGMRLECAFGMLTPGSERTVAVSARVDPTLAAGSLTNVATITSPTAPAPIVAETTIAIVERAAMTIAKTAAATIEPGVIDGAIWTITLHNAGPSVARSVIVDDVLPAGVTGVRIEGFVGCLAFPCSLGDLPPGAEVTARVIGTVDSAATGVLANSATVSTATPDPEPGDNSSTSTSTLTPFAALRLTKTGPATAIPGTPITWSIGVVNDGPATAAGVRLVDPLPAALDPASVTISGDCTALPCDLGDLPPGATRLVSVNGRILPGAVGNLENSATVESPTAAPTGGDQRASTVTTGLVQTADLQITKVFSGTSATPGEAVRWLITVVNTGPSDATNVVVNDVLPAGAIPDARASTTAGTCTETRCDLGTVAAGSTVEVVVDGTLPSDWLPGTAPDAADGALVNTATVASPTFDPSTGSDRATTSTTVTPRANLAITKAGPTGPVVPGERVEWTITVVNSGPSFARQVGITDALPAGFQPDRLEPTANCQLSAGPAGTSTVTCGWESLAGGERLEVTVSGLLGADYLDPTLLNTARVLSPTPDPDPTDNTSSATNESTPRADVTLSAAASVPTAAAGETVGWRFTVTNHGPSAAASTVVRIPWPAALAAAGDPVLTGASPGATWRVVDGVLIVELGSLPPSAPVTIAVDMMIASTFTAGSVTVSATVTTTTTQPDGHRADQASTAIDVANRADLRLTKTIDNPTVRWNEIATFRIAVTNIGPSSAERVVVADPLPADLLPLTGTWPGGTCSVVGQLVRCELGDLDPGTVTVTVTARAVGNGATSNTATVASTTADTSGDDHLAAAPLTIERHSDLSVSKTVSAPEAVQGGRVTFTVVARAAGPDEATGVIVTDRVPAALHLVSVTTTTGRYDPVSATWTIGTMAAGATETMTMVVEATELGRAVNTAAISGPVIDPTPAEANASASFVVVKPNQGALPGTGGDARRGLGWAAGLLLLGGFLRLAAARRRTQPGSSRS